MQPTIVDFLPYCKPLLIQAFPTIEKETKSSTHNIMLTTVKTVQSNHTNIRTISQYITF